MTSGTANLLDTAGKSFTTGDLYFLDGVSGGAGVVQAGETVPATVCFTCEEALLDEPWADVVFRTSIKPATDTWTYFTDVEPSGVKVEFERDSAIFDVTGKVTNNTGSTVERISVRVLVHDQDGNLIGAAENSAYDVPAGATVDVRGYGIGEPPSGAFDIEVSALGVNY